MLRRVVPGLVACAALFASPRAQAEPDVWEKPLATMAEVGFGTPVGYCGVNEAFVLPGRRSGRGVLTTDSASSAGE